MELLSAVFNSTFEVHLVCEVMVLESFLGKTFSLIISRLCLAHEGGTQSGDSLHRIPVFLISLIDIY